MRFQPTLYFTPEEYLILSRRATYKSEYIDGGIFAVVNESKAHHLIVGNLFTALHKQLKKRPAFIYALNMSVQVNPSGLQTYPDIVVTGDDEAFVDAYQDTLLNPIVIIEVISDSTEMYDRGFKFKWYCQVDSLKEYFLIAQDKYLIEQAVRQADNEWLWTKKNNQKEIIFISSIDCQITLAEVYQKVF
jgi:Uma2 family endonuclease